MEKLCDISLFYEAMFAIRNTEKVLKKLVGIIKRIREINYSDIKVKTFSKIYIRKLIKPLYF